MTKACRCIAVAFALVACGAREPARNTAKVTRAAFDAGGSRLIIELVSDEVLHVELAPAVGAFSPERPIPTSPMIATGAKRTPRGFVVQGRRLVSDSLIIDVGSDLCMTVQRESSTVGRFCPALETAGSKLAIEPPPGANAYGLGQQCVEPGLSGGDWLGRVRKPGGPFGHRMVKFDGGNCGDTQIPILYVVGQAARQFALFVDDPRAQTWSFERQPWAMTSPSTVVRFYVLTGSTVANLRERYLDLTGRPPVPPRAAFGLWVSEFGYDDWNELDDVLAGLRAQQFPVDGFVLDLQWFGACIDEHRPGCDGTGPGRDDSPMGRLVFDERHFPNAAVKLAELRKQGIGIIPIEESYVGRALPEHARLAAEGFLAASSNGAPVYLDQTPWWGKGGMIDWTHPKAGDTWHDWKRQPLVAMGVVGHWTDLGEPELYDPGARYAGGDHASIHNLYNLAWAASIARGYQRQRSERRPFILTRSGTAGIQRYGAAMWSGDLGSRYTTLASQLRNQLHMAMSGIDYYGSDVGGFDRTAAGDSNVDELYTQWFADAAMIEVPLRPHTNNLTEKYETSPDRIGHRASNLAALRLRYSLVPYLYSLAHRAHRVGEAIVPPLFYAYPDDPAVRTIGDEKLIGRDLLVALVAAAGQRERHVYLPKGTWFEFRSGVRHDSEGAWLAAVPLYRGDVLELPLYARAGAIIPMQWVDGQTMNTTGRRRDGTTREELRIRSFAGVGTNTLYEDDGETVAYLAGEVRETVLRQTREADGITIEVGPARGSYRGAIERRAIVLEVIGVGEPLGVELDGTKMSGHKSIADWERANEGWLVEAGQVRIKAPATAVTTARRFRLRIKP